MIIRRATPADAAAIAAIANPIVRDTAITFTTEEKTEAGLAEAIHTGQRYWLAEDAAQIIGYATYFAFRNGPGYARTKEHTIGLDPAGRGRGAGRALMAALEAHAASEGVHSLFAGVSGENDVGVAFHAALGFREVARLQQVGRKFGRWHDLVLMQKFLSEATARR